MTPARVPGPEPIAATEARLPWIVCIRLVAALSIALWAVVALLIRVAL